MGTGRSKDEATTAAQWIEKGIGKIRAQKRRIAAGGITARRRLRKNVFIQASLLRN
jgi:hypothetical protein